MSWIKQTPDSCTTKRTQYLTTTAPANLGQRADGRTIGRADGRTVGQKVERSGGRAGGRKRDTRGTQERHTRGSTDIIGTQEGRPKGHKRGTEGILDTRGTQEVRKRGTRGTRGTQEGHKSHLREGTTVHQGHQRDTKVTQEQHKRGTTTWKLAKQMNPARWCGAAPKASPPAATSRDSVCVLLRFLRLFGVPLPSRITCLASVLAGVSFGTTFCPHGPMGSTRFYHC